MALRRTLSALLITMLVALGACGDDDGGSVADDAPSSTETLDTDSGSTDGDGAADDGAADDGAADDAAADDVADLDEPDDSSEGDSAAGGADEYCRLANHASRVVEREYVGSDEHIAEFDALIAVAPDDIVDDFQRVRDHMANAVSPADPDSQDFENFPADVQAAAMASQDHITANC